MGFRWIILWGVAGLFASWQQGNLLIAVITLATCLMLYGLRNVVLRLNAIQKHFGFRLEQDDQDDTERGAPF